MIKRTPPPSNAIHTLALPKVDPALEDKVLSKLDDLAKVLDNLGVVQLFKRKARELPTTENIFSEKVPEDSALEILKVIGLPEQFVEAKLYFVRQGHTPDVLERHNNAHQYNVPIGTEYTVEKYSEEGDPKNITVEKNSTHILEGQYHAVGATQSGNAFLLILYTSKDPHVFKDDRVPL